MTSTVRPDFLYNEFVFKEDGKWIYEEDAPSDIKQKVDDYNKQIEKINKTPLM